MKKKLLTIVLTALLVLSVVTLGVANVFRVDGVTLVARFTPYAGVTAEALQEELIAAYKKESIFSVDGSDAETVAKKYPYLRVVGFKKRYPDKLTITIVEDSETYAVENQDGYYILNAAGIVVAKRSTPDNRVDRSPNLLLKGMQLYGEVGGTLTGDKEWRSMFTLCSAMDELLEGIRTNVVAAEVVSRKPQTFYRFIMREGVKLYFEDPLTLTKEKGQAAIEKYSSLKDSERMTGRITVHVVEGVAIAEYKSIDEFE